METENITKYGHDLKNTLKICHQYQIFPLNLSFDTLIASYLLHPERHRHLLQNLAIQELSLNIDVTIDQDKNKTDDLNTTHQTSSYEAAWIWQLQNVLLNKLKEKKLFPLFQELELPLIPILNKMEEAGIILDPKPLKKLAIDLNERIKKISNQIYQLAGKEFNINSPKQLQEILFTALQINTKGLKKTKTGISTADDEAN
jgi:DNA polymerase-1